MAARLGIAPAPRLSPGELSNDELAAIKARVAALNLRGWFDELTRLLRLSDHLRLDWLAADAPWRAMELAGWPMEEPVRLVVPEKREQPLPARILPALVVSLAAPDSVILEDFKRKLKGARRQYPQPYSSRGRAKQGKPIDWSMLFKSWCNYRIVELAELLARRHRQPEGSKPSMTALAARLRLNTDRNRIGRAEEALRGAIASLPELVAQLRHDGVSGDLAPERTAALPGIDANGRLMLAAEALEWSASADPSWRAEGAKQVARLLGAPAEAEFTLNPHRH